MDYPHYSDDEDLLSLSGSSKDDGEEPYDDNTQEEYWREDNEDRMDYVLETAAGMTRHGYSLEELKVLVQRGNPPQYDSDYFCEEKEGSEDEDEDLDYPSEEEGEPRPRKVDNDDGSQDSVDSDDAMSEDDDNHVVEYHQEEYPIDDPYDDDDQDDYESQVEKDESVSEDDQNYFECIVSRFEAMFECSIFTGHMEKMDESFVRYALSVHPFLAREKYRDPRTPYYYDPYDPYGEDLYTWTPFVHLLCAGAETETLLSAWPGSYVLQDTVWVPKEEVFMTPISIACLHRNTDTKLIEWMAYAHPGALLTPCRDDGDPDNYWNIEDIPKLIGKLPLHIAMEQGAPAATIKVLLDKGPKAVFQLTTMEGYGTPGTDCFSLAYEEYGEGDVLDMVLKTIHDVASQSEETYNILGFAFGMFDVPFSLLQRLLVGLRKVKMSRDNVDSLAGGWHQFIAWLGNNQTLQSLDVDWETFSQNPLDGASLALCLKRNSTLQELHLDFGCGILQGEYHGESDWKGSDHSALQGLVAGLPYNSTLRRLRISNCFFQNDCIPHKLLTGPSGLEELDIGFTRTFAAAAAAAMAPISTPPSSSLKDIFLYRNEMPLPSLLRVFRSIAKMSQLQNLQVFHWRNHESEIETEHESEIETGQIKVALTSAVVELLARNKLGTLNLSCMPLDLSSIHEALKHNTSLRTFLRLGVQRKDESTMLELLETNTSLVCLHQCDNRDVPYPDDRQLKMQILLECNLLGRGKLKPGFSLKPFVDLLADIPKSSTPMAEERPLDIYYRLMLHCPSIWCTAGAGKPSKAGAGKPSKAGAGKPVTQKQKRGKSCRVLCDRKGSGGLDRYIPLGRRQET